MLRHASATIMVWAVRHPSPRIRNGRDTVVIVSQSCSSQPIIQPDLPPGPCAVEMRSAGGRWFRPAVNDEAVDHHGVDQDHRERPEREVGEVAELHNHIDADDHDAHDTRPCGAVEDRESGEDHDDADDQYEPTPG